MGRLEEKVGRMEKEKAEMMVKIEQGDGFNAAVQQLQQDNVSGSIRVGTERLIILFGHRLGCKAKWKAVTCRPLSWNVFCRKPRINRLRSGRNVMSGSDQSRNGLRNYQPL